MIALALVASLLIHNAVSCGVRGSSNRIVGGTESSQHEWPWQASLRAQYLGGLFESHICGATIINDQWLVTAAHCVDGQSARSLKVVVGDHDKSGRQSSEVSYSISRIIMHELYDGNSLSTEGLPHDIALLQIQGLMTFNDQIQPACLPNNPTWDVAGNRDCWITGWGLTQGPQDENKLQKLNIEVRTNEDCANIWGEGMIHNTHVCLGYGNTGACNGDSGGPLVCGHTDGRYYLVGATSWGRSGCQTEGYPSVYTRVSMYISWIENNMSF